MLILLCVFYPAILLLAGFLFHQLTHFLHCIFGLCHLVCFCSVWYLLLSALSVSFRSSCRAGLVVSKSLSNCLSIKDFISPSFMKLSFCWIRNSGLKVLFFKDVEYWPPLSSGCEFDWLPFVGNPTFLCGCP